MEATMEMQPQSWKSLEITFSGLLSAQSTLGVQLVLLVFYAALWSMFIPWFSRTIVRPHMEKATYKQQWIELNQKVLAAMGVVLKDEETVFDTAVTFIPVALQHGVGGMLCLPALFNIFSTEVNIALALHGALNEAGWELQDCVTRGFEVMFGGEEGKKKNPTSLLVLLGLHHAMGLSMVIPLNLFFRNLEYYHESVFMLQGAAFFAMAFQQYGFTLDVSKPKDMRIMKGVVATVFAIMFYTRGVRYIYVTYQLLTLLYAEGSAVMLGFGSTVATFMAGLNVLFLKDAANKVRKYWWVLPVILALESATEEKEQKKKVE